MKMILSSVSALSLLIALMSAADVHAARKSGKTPRESSSIDREGDQGSGRSSRRARRSSEQRCRGFMEDSSSGEGMRGFIEPGLYDSGERGSSEP